MRHLTVSVAAFGVLAFAVATVADEPKGDSPPKTILTLERVESMVKYLIETEPGLCVFFDVDGHMARSDGLSGAVVEYPNLLRPPGIGPQCMCWRRPAGKMKRDGAMRTLVVMQARARVRENGYSPDAAGLPVMNK